MDSCFGETILQKKGHTHVLDAQAPKPGEHDGARWKSSTSLQLPAATQDLSFSPTPALCMNSGVLPTRLLVWPLSGFFCKNHQETSSHSFSLPPSLPPSLSLSLCLSFSLSEVIGHGWVNIRHTSTSKHATTGRSRPESTVGRTCHLASATSKSAPLDAFRAAKPWLLCIRSSPCSSSPPAARKVPSWSEANRDFRSGKKGRDL